MNKKIITAAISLLGLFAPFAFANAASVTIASLTPGQSVVAKDRIMFGIVPTGFNAVSYQLTDSFPGSSANISNLSATGNFFWVPVVSDVGTHVFTITASDGVSNTGTVTQTVTVLPLPALAITNVSPGTTVMPGNKFSFTILNSGLTNPVYSISDTFSGSSITSANLDASGNFSWTPEQIQTGDHSITFYAYDSSGHNASVTQSVHVGVGPTLSVILLSPGAVVPFGTTTSFTATPSSFAPTSFSVTDSFIGSRVSNSNIDTSGHFSWTPLAADVGEHLLTIKGVVGTYGQSTTTTQKITVTGANGATTSALVVTPVVTTTAASTSTQPVTTATTGTKYLFQNFMGIGEDTTDGPDVLELQKRLAGLKLLSGVYKGYFGVGTQLAVKKYQKAHGIPATGFVGSLTRAELNK
jgi:hypothetical protein